jgi:hypothetical protein
MRTRNRGLVFALVPAVAASLSVPAAARDREFSAVVHHIESTYHVHRNYRFLMWGVGMAVRVAHPEGVRSLRMAIFDDQKLSGIGDDMQFTSLLEQSLDRGWQPFVRVWSRRDNERTYIYARPRGNDLELYIISLESDEAVVLKLRMNPDKLDEMMDEPKRVSQWVVESSANVPRALATEATGD